MQQELEENQQPEHASASSPARELAQARVEDPALEAPALGGPHPGAQALNVLLQHHLALDGAIDRQLKAVIGDTESAALALVQQVRTLSDSASALLVYLNKSGVSALSMEEQIAGSVSAITQVNRFVQVLPMIREGAASIQTAAMKEIDGLKSFTSVIKDISEQTRFLAVNIAIVAATSGESGKAFAVVAREMRLLSARSASAATMIEGGLEGAQRTMREGLMLNKMDEQLSEAHAILGSLRKVEETYEDVRQYYKTLFAVVFKHNTEIASEIAEILGNIQYQDVVRQRIERITSAMAHRNAVLEALPSELGDSSAHLAQLAAGMRQVLDDYVAGEQRHQTAVASDADDLPKIELF